MAVVGDVSGKGVQAAAVATAARHTFRAAALHGSSPAETAAMIDRAIVALREPGLFCTAVLAAGRQGSGRASVVVAGHPVPLLVRGDGEVEALEASTTVLGALPDLALDPTEVHLRAGDSLVVYTDGLTDGPGGGVDVARLLAGATSDQLVGRLDRLRAPGGRDDVAVLALTRTG
nr:PP2C family protein-serine/threonine phosphatase [Rhabdothermincola salaria]